MQNLKKGRPTCKCSENCPIANRALFLTCWSVSPSPLQPHCNTACKCLVWRETKKSSSNSTHNLKALKYDSHRQEC